MCGPNSMDFHCINRRLLLCFMRMAASEDVVCNKTKVSPGHGPNLTLSSI